LIFTPTLVEGPVNTFSQLIVGIFSFQHTLQNFLIKYVIILGDQGTNVRNLISDLAIYNPNRVLFLHILGGND